MRNKSQAFSWDIPRGGPWAPPPLPGQTTPPPVFPFIPPIGQPRTFEPGLPTIAPSEPGPNPPPPVNPPNVPPTPRLRPPLIPQPLSPSERTLFSKNISPRIDPSGRERFTNGRDPLGDLTPERLGDILKRHLSLFDGLTLEDFFTFLPPHAGIIWLKPDDEKLTKLGNAEGRLRINKDLRDAQKNNIVKRIADNLAVYANEIAKTPKTDAVGLVTSPSISPNRPSLLQGDFRRKFDRRTRGRSTMASTIPPALADKASTTPEYPIVTPNNISMIQDTSSSSDVSLVQKEARLLAAKAYDEL